MRFLIRRIADKFPLLNKYWSPYQEKSDFQYFQKNCKNYKIIPFGNYCLPRVVTTLNRLKPTKKYGEESFPFDLCFSDFECNIKLLSNKFRGFYKNLKIDKTKNCYINKQLNMIFNHDVMPLDEFKTRYNNRIKNLYTILKNNDKYLYFIIATFKPITNKLIESFIKEITKYRETKTYSIIVINQSERPLRSHRKNVYCIDLFNDSSFKYLNRTRDWCKELKKMDTFSARFFNHKLYKKLKEIIKSNSRHTKRHSFRWTFSRYLTTKFRKFFAQPN